MIGARMRKAIVSLTTAAASLVLAAPALGATEMTLSAGMPAEAGVGEKFYVGVIGQNVGSENSGTGLLTIDLPPEIEYGGGIGVCNFLSTPQQPVCEEAAYEPAAAGSMTHLPFIVLPGAEPGPVEIEISLALANAPTVELTKTVVIRDGDGTFGLSTFENRLVEADGTPSTRAGAHPYALETVLDSRTRANPAGEVIPAANLRNVTVELPPGLVGNPASLPTCDTKALNTSSPISSAACPPDSQVGVLDLFTGFAPLRLGVFNMEVPDDRPARFAFMTFGRTVVFDGSVRTDSDYGVTISVRNIDQTLAIYSTKLTMWGKPQATSHDWLRGICGGASNGTGPSLGCPRAAQVRPTAFLTNPTSCNAAGEGMETKITVESWQGETDSAVYTSDDGSGNPEGMSGCDSVPFDPTVTAAATSGDASTPSGLNFKLQVPDTGLLNPDGIAQSHLKKAVVSLPEGMTVNASAAEGLGVCSEAAYARETLGSLPGEGCPLSSKIGTIEIETPLLDKPALGSFYIAEPYANQSGTLLALYMVARVPQRGVLIKAAGKIEPDPRTGKLVTTFDDLPQLPFSSFNLRFREGARAPLVTPPTCGSYEVSAELTPYSDLANPRTTTASFAVGRGVGGSPCPSGGVPPFRPGFNAGSINNNAGSHTPFTMRLTRNDGEQQMTRFSASLPKGVLAKLAGVGKCPEGAIAAAKAKSGSAELAAPSCPAATQIGTVQAGAGVGPVLTYVSGKAYLAGPFGGAPLSVVVITPAVAGPFDVGTVVVREALTLDPKTAEVRVDGGLSDPIPHILAGIPLNLRDLRVDIDRPDFVLNPTSCDPSQVGATVFGSGLDLFGSADDRPVDLSSRFQAASCASLAFKPRIDLLLKGGAKRGAHPSLRATFRARPGDANLGRAQVTLPRSAFLDQGNIRTICNRVRFAAKDCPPGSVYGYARAVSPLLDEPLQGPVYLRSSNNKLPNIVADLKGLVDIELVGRIDSHKRGIRATFEEVPDAPVSSFTLTMQGGKKKGLVINSQNLCAKQRRAIVKLDGQNGKAHDFNPVVRSSSCKGSAARNRGR